MQTALHIYIHSHFPSNPMDTTHKLRQELLLALTWPTDCADPVLRQLYGAMHALQAFDAVLEPLEVVVTLLEFGCDLNGPHAAAQELALAMVFKAYVGAHVCVWVVGWLGSRWALPIWGVGLV